MPPATAQAAKPATGLAPRRCRMRCGGHGPHEGVALAALVAAALAADGAAVRGLALLWLNPRDLNRRHGTSPPQSTPALIERGAYLARRRQLHAGCHTAARRRSRYAGGRGHPDPLRHRVRLQSDARRRQHGLGDWSGRRLLARAASRPQPRDGRLLSPAFTRYPNYDAAHARGQSTRMYVYLKTQPGAVVAAGQSAARTALALWHPAGASRLARALLQARRCSSPILQRDAAWNRGAYLVQGPGPLQCLPWRRAMRWAVVPGADRFRAAACWTRWAGYALRRWHDAGEAGVAALERCTELQRMAARPAATATGTSRWGRWPKWCWAVPQHLNEADLAAMGRYLQARCPSSAAPRSRGRRRRQTAALRDSGAGKLYRAALYEPATAPKARASATLTGIPAYPALAGNRVSHPWATAANLLRVILRGGFAPGHGRASPSPFGMPPFARRVQVWTRAGRHRQLSAPVSWGHQAGDVDTSSM